VPDQRRHRGPHPEDLRYFDPSCWPALREATADLGWLLSRGYPRESALKLVGDSRGLVARQRIAVSRCACSDAEVERRLRHQVAHGSLAGRSLRGDAYNVLTTIEAALSGGIILAARDGTYRDMASMHGSYRKVAETRPALELLGRTIAAMGVGEVFWLLDRPVSNSGRLKALMELVARAAGWSWRVELVPDPDPLLMASQEVVATADSAVLDRCEAWLNLARETIVRHVPEARIADLSDHDVSASS